MTTPERLTLLLPLANGDTLTEKDLRRRVFDFLYHFEARGLRLQSGEHELWDAHGASAAELAAIQKKVQLVFATGFMFVGTQGSGKENIGPDDVWLPLSFPSLRFGAFHPTTKGRPHAKGRFMLIVEAGRLRDLVPYLAMWLLTTEEIAVSRCQAPQRRNWKERCNRFLIWGGHGRPPKTCSRACAARVKAKRVYEQQRRERDAWKAAQRARQQQQRQQTQRRRSQS